MSDKERYFSCACNSEVLRVSKWEDCGTVIFSFLAYRNYNRVSIWDRVKKAWNILKGNYHVDEFLLYKDDSQEFANFMMELTK